jgi:hypothetical protein
MKTPLVYLLAGAALAAAPLTQASGTYTSRPPRPGATREAGVDRALYDLGQKVFRGKAAPAQGDAATQRPRLAALQGRLPASAARKTDLNALAGKVSDEQLAALEYYVGRRYGSK